MNQILYIQKSKNGNSMDINTIIKIFTIIIIIFGVILISKGIFGITSNLDESKLKSEPIVAAKEINDKLELKITHNKAIDKIVYSWNGNEENVLQGKGRTEIYETIELPAGNNMLNLQIVDKDKNIVTYTNQYYREEQDTLAPEIEFVVEGSKVKLVVKDDIELYYVMYHWNDEDNTIIEPREDSKKQIEEKISILKGENTLIITAVDAAGNEITKEQIFKGAKKPTIDVSQDNDELIIKIKDEENIQKIEININGESFSTDPENNGNPLNMKEAELRQKLQVGNNKIIITAYNISGLSEQITKEITI